MKLHSIFLLLLFTSTVLAQQLTVVNAKRAFTNNSKIETSDILTFEQTISIKRKGIIELHGTSSKNMILREGTYELGTEFRSHVDKHLSHDEIHRQLDSLGFLSCNYDYDYILIGPGNRHGSTKRIELERLTNLKNQSSDFIAIINSRLDSSILIRWQDFYSGYNGKYYLLLQDINQTYQQLISANTNSFELDLSGYIEDQTPWLFLKVFAEDCRETGDYGIGFLPFIDLRQGSFKTTSNKRSCCTTPPEKQ